MSKSINSFLENYQRIAIFLLFPFIISCDNSANMNSTEISVEEIKANGDYIDEQGYDVLRRRVEIINSKTGFDTSLANYFHLLPQDKIPEIDFQKQKVVMLGLGVVRGNERAEFISAKDYGEYIKFSYKLFVSCMNCITQDSGTSPLTIYVLDTKKKIIINENIEVFGSPVSE